jgi:endonuclease YncB( thermonuclease family)
MTEIVIDPDKELERFYTNTYKNVPFFSLNKLEFPAKVLRILDGDTIIVCFYYIDKKLYRWRCRLEGLDTAEVSSKNERIKGFALSIKNKLKDMILFKDVVLRCGEFDKYGRILVTIFSNDINVNEWLLKKKYAVPYTGGTKKPEENWLPIIDEVEKQ